MSDPLRTHTHDPAAVPPAPADDTATSTAAGPAGRPKTVVLDGPPVPGPPAPDGGVAPPGYKVLGELGRGGMGVVYRAVQVGLNRPVALKMVLGDHRADSKELIRFLAEAEAVAAVRHPHVVGVYEYGDHAGRPYLAMEFCPGGSLADRLAGGGRLAPRAAAGLVEAVARGVAAAHDQGIVHRDLKPANVLFDGQGGPKVADFGLAKRGPGADLTATGAVIGTPAYMAPEQAGGNAKLAGPPADVWALGVILYEALTGTRPFPGADHWAVLDKVKSAAPAPPGSRARGVTRDLELICLKCLRKEPHERYPTAAGLAADLRAHLDGKPVAARPVSGPVKAWKWAKRNRLVAVSAAAAVSARFAVRARAEADRAKQQEEKAVANLKAAGRAVDECYSLVADDPRLKGDHLKPVRGLLSEAALKYYREFTREVPDDLSLLGEYARNLERVVDITRDIGSNQEALAGCRDLLAARERLLAAAPADPAARMDLGHAHGRHGTLLDRVGQRDAAVAALRASAGMFDGVADERDDPEARFAAAKAHHSLGLTYREMTRRGEALAAFDRSVELLTGLLARQPGDQRYKHQLAVTQGSIGYFHHLLTAQQDGGREKANAAYEASRKLARELTAADPKNPQYRATYGTGTGNLGILYLRLYKDPERARELYQESRDVYQRLADEYPFELGYTRSVGNAAGNLANVAVETGRYEDAVKFREESTRLYERLLAGNPDDVRAITHHGNQLAGAADLHLRLSRPDRSLDVVGRAVAQFRKVHGQAPDDYYNQDYLAQALTTQGSAHLLLGQVPESRAAFEEAVTHSAAVNAKLPGLAKYISRLSEAYRGLADAHRRAADPAAAAAATRKRRDLLPDNPDALVTVARDFAACVPLAKADADRAEYVGLALETLRQARAAGFEPVGWLKAVDWPPAVRGHPEFAALVAGATPRGPAPR